MDAIGTVDAAQWLPAARGIAAGLVLFVLLWAYDRRESLSSRGRLILGFSAAALGLAGLTVCAYRVATNFLSPRDWDFLCFWSYGRALALGQSPYDIAVLREIAAPLNPSAEFQSLNYCNYPPICLPLFWPLGYVSFPVAMATWYAVQISALAASIVLLRRYWDESRTWLGLAVTLGVVLTWHSTSSTLFYAQSTFLILLAILMAIHSQSPTWRGIWLGVAMVVKPIAAILMIDLAIRRQWRSVLACTAPLLLALGSFLLAQGVPGLLQYRDRNPLAGNVAFSFYVEEINDSLLAVLLRFFGSQPLAQPVFFLPFVIALGLLTAVTVAVLLRLPSRLESLGMGYVVTLALLAYPGTLKHYSILLFVSAALLWHKRSSVPGGAVAAVVTIAVAYGLVWSRWNFAAHLMVWTVFTVSLALASFKHSAASDAIAAPTR